jgi:transcription antitermination protein NusB
MKTSDDPRHKRRIEMMSDLFAWSFHSEQVTPLIADILPHMTILDENIQRAAPTWSIDKIAKIDLSILRLAVYELMMEKQAPPKVTIDEAVELGKAYGNPNSSKFINGVLGTLLKTMA